MKILVVLLWVVLLAGCSVFTSTVPNIGDPAPAFDTVRLDGTPANFPADWAGRPLVINFWADWCPSCESEMKAIERVYQRRKGKGLEILAVNVRQEPGQVAAFTMSLGVTYPILLDPKAILISRYGVIGLPTTFLVDNQGIVRAKLVGELDEAVFEKHVLELLK